jgi:hypothetical protein
MMLNKMIDFYRTQDLVKQCGEKVDMLAMHDIVIQYDPFQDAILITKMAVMNNPNDVVSRAPPSLRPKLASIPLPTSEARHTWEEPTIPRPDQAYGFEYFMDEEANEDRENHREG